MRLFQLEASDRINPIVVKEVRQGLRSKSFVFSFVSLLALCLVICFASLSGPYNARQGRDMFEMTFGSLALLSFFVLPLSAYQSVVADRTGETWPTLVLTRLTARQILRGKIVSTLVQGALLGCTAGPFMVFSYFLGGISLLEIGAALCFIAAVESFVATLSVSWGAVSSARQSAVSMVALLAALVAAASLAFMLFDQVVRGRYNTFAGEVLASAAFAATLALVIFELAASRIALVGDNTVMGPRLALFAHLSVAVLAAALNHNELALFMFNYGLAWLFFFAIAGISGRIEAPRHFRGKSWLLAPFFPGAVPAWRSAVVLAVFWSATFAFAHSKSGKEFLFLSLPALFVSYLGVVVSARAFATRMKEETFAGASTLAVLGALAAGPLVLAISGPVLVDNAVYALTNPLLALAEASSYRKELFEETCRWGVPVQLVVALSTFAIADRLLRRREALQLRGEQ